MKHMWLAGAVAGVMLAGIATAQTQPETPSTQIDRQTPPAQPMTQKPTTQKPMTEKPAQPATQKPATEKPAQPATEKRATRPSQATGDVPTGETVLGTVTIPRAVTADGKPLAAGRYTVRLTTQAAQPTVAGQKPDLNRWVEFVQGGQVRGREVVSIVPAEEVKDTMPGPDMPGRVGPTGSRVEMLKGGEYLRVWIARGGHHYLVHLPPSGAKS